MLKYVYPLFYKKMNKNLNQALVYFLAGKYTHFETIYQETVDQVLNFFLSHTQNNTPLSQHLTSHTMNQFLEWLTEQTTLTTEDMEASLMHFAHTQRNHYQELITPSSNNQEHKSQFITQLKLKLNSKLQEKKSQNPNFLAYYFHHFRFYFTGFCIALAVGLSSFLFWFLTFNKTPTILSNPKRYILTWEIAFWPINTKAPQTTLNHSTTLTVAAPHYHLKLKNIPKLPTSLFLAQQTTNLLPFSRSKYLSLPTLSSSERKSNTLEQISFQQGEASFDLNLKTHKLSITQPTRPIIPKTYTTSEKTIKNLIKTQLTQRWLKLDHYDIPQIINPKLEGEIIVFFPELFQKTPIFDQRGQQKGLFVYYHVEYEHISKVENFNFQSYHISRYPLITTADDLLQKSVNYGISITTTPPSFAIPLSKGKLVYQEQGTFLIPMIKFEKEEDSLFLPIF